MVLTDSIAHSPKLVSPRVAFNEFVVVRGEKPLFEARRLELLANQVLHDLELHLLPIGAQGNPTSSPLGLTGCGTSPDELPFSLIKSFGSLVSVFVRRVNHSIQRHRMAVKI